MSIPCILGPSKTSLLASQQPCQFFNSNKIQAPGRQDLWSPSLSFPARVQPYLVSAWPHDMVTAKHLPIQTAAKIEASLFQDSKAKDNGLQTTPKYLCAKRLHVIDLATGLAKHNLWPATSNPRKAPVATLSQLLYQPPLYLVPGAAFPHTHPAPATSTPGTYQQTPFPPAGATSVGPPSSLFLPPGVTQ
jgi:hypothetical protein